MAAMFFAKNALMNITKSFPQTLWFPSSSVSARKVSRVSFTTAYSSSNPNQDRNTAAGEMRDRAGYRAADEKHDKDSLGDEASGTIEAGTEKARKWSGDAQEKMKDNMDSAKEKAGEWKEKAKDSSGSMKDKTMDAMESGKEKTKDVAGTMRDKAKSGADNATQTVSNAGEKAKETVKNVWEATKDTTQKIKETVVGKAEDISSDDEDVADRKDTRDP